MECLESLAKSQAYVEDPTTGGIGYLLQKKNFTRSWIRNTPGVLSRIHLVMLPKNKNRKMATFVDAAVHEEWQEKHGGRLFTCEESCSTISANNKAKLFNEAIALKKECMKYVFNVYEQREPTWKKRERSLIAVGVKCRMLFCDHLVNLNATSAKSSSFERHRERERERLFSKPIILINIHTYIHN